VLPDGVADGFAGVGLQRRLRQGVQEADSGWIYDHVTRDVRPDDAEAFSLMPEGGIYSDLPARLQRYRADIFDDPGDGGGQFHAEQTEQALRASEEKYRQLAMRVGNSLVESQKLDGTWNLGDFFPEEAALDIAAEMVVWLDESCQTVGSERVAGQAV